MKNKLTVCQQTVLSLEQILQYDNLPHGRKSTLLCDLKTGYRLQVDQAKLGFFKRALSKGVCSPEINSLARRIVRSKDKGRIRNEERRIMRSTIADIARNIEEVKWRHSETLREVRNLLSNRSYRSYKKLKHEEMSKIWEREKLEKKDKLKWWIQK